MDVAAWSPLGVAVLGLGAAAVQQRRRRPVLRELIKADLELWEKLPESSESRAELLKDVDRRVRKLIKDESEKRRDASGMTVGALMVGIFTWLGWLAWDAGGLWRWSEFPIAFLWIIGVVGFFTSTQKTVRDEKGNVIKEPPSL